MSTYNQEPQLVGLSTDGTGTANKIVSAKGNADGSTAVGSVPNADPWAVQVWVAPLGGPIIADAAGPGVDAAQPSASRVIIAGPRAGRMGVQTFGQTAGNFLTYVVGGTTLVYRVWIFDTTLNTWVAKVANTTITVATQPGGAINMGNVTGAKLYAQVVSVTGTITNFGYDWG